MQKLLITTGVIFSMCITNALAIDNYIDLETGEHVLGQRVGNLFIDLDSGEVEHQIKLFDNLILDEDMYPTIIHEIGDSE